MGKKFPTIQRILIDERDRYMVQHLVSANDQFEKVVAVVGDGHIPGLQKLLSDKDVDYKTVRLSELRNFKVDDSNLTSASFSMEYRGFE